MKKSAQKKFSKISKKSLLTILSILFFLIIVSLAIMYFLMGNGSREDFNSRYSETLSACDMKFVSLLKREYSCKAFVRDVVDPETGEVCFDMYVFSEKENDLLPIYLCEEKGKVEWKNPYTDYEKLVPVDFTISVRGSFLSPTVLLVKGTLMSDDDVLEVARGEYLQSFVLREVRLWEIEEILYNGYYTNDIFSFADGELNQLIVSEIEILSARVNAQSNIVLTMKMILKGVEVISEVEVPSFSLMRDREGGEEDGFVESDVYEITASNIGDLDTSLKYRGLFYYLLEDSMPSLESVGEYCEGEFVDDFTGVWCSYYYPDMWVGLSSFDEFVDGVIGGSSSFGDLIFNSLTER